MPKRIMREFALFEVSAVDRPCQEGARMVIAKRAPCPECGGANGDHAIGCPELTKGGPGSGPHPGQGGSARSHLQSLKDEWARVGREEGWSSPEAKAAERKMLSAQRRYGVVKEADSAICKECGGKDGIHLEKCGMYGKTAPWWPDFVEDPYTVGGTVLEYCKREFTAAQRQHASDTGAAMPGGGFPIQSEADLHNAIRAIGRAKNPAAARAHIKTRAKALGLSSAIPDTWKAATALEHFQPLLKLAADYDAPTPALAPVYAAIVKAAPDIDALPEDERKETLDRLMGKCAEKLAKIVPSGSIDAFKAAIAAKGAGEMDPKELEKLQKRAALLELLAKATDVVKAFMTAEKMDEAAQAAFLAKSEEDQAKAIKAKKPPPKDDDENEPDEDDMKKALKKRDTVIADLTKNLAVLQAKDELAVCKDLCRKAGVAEGKAEFLAKLRKLEDPAIAEDTLKEWSAAAKQTNPLLFAELGKSGGSGSDDPTTEIMTKAAEIRTAVNKAAKPHEQISIEKARVLAREQFPDLAKAEREIEHRRRTGRAA